MQFRGLGIEIPTVNEKTKNWSQSLEYLHDLCTLHFEYAVMDLNENSNFYIFNYSMIIGFNFNSPHNY